MDPHPSIFDHSINTGAAEQPPLQSTSGSSSSAQSHQSDAHRQVPDQRASNSFPLTSGTPSTIHNDHSSQRTTSSLRHSPSYMTNHTAHMQGQPTIVPCFNPSAAGLSACKNLTRPLTMREKEYLLRLDGLKRFLATAPSQWPQMDSALQNNSFPNHSSPWHSSLNRFLLPSSEHVTCVCWNNRYYITGTDIVRALVFRFEAFGRPVKNMKKFEEGIFSDLRNLKPGEHASLEEPKSPFLDHLFKYQCIRTQKKQKVFYWFSVPHDRLFLDALERDLKRENQGLELTTTVIGEPALSFTYEPQRSLYEQFSKTPNVIEVDDNALGNIDVPQMNRNHDNPGLASVPRVAAVHNSNLRQLYPQNSRIDGGGPSALHDSNRAYFPHPIFDGSPTYKQRRKRSANRSVAPTRSSSEEGSYVSAPDIGIGYGPNDSGMTASDMFVSQARGEQDVVVRRAKAMLQACGDANWSGALPLRRSSVQNASAGFGQLSNRVYASQPDLLSYTEDPSPHPFHSDTNGYSNTGNGLTTKVFACPLVCCGRMFKRMEHLKRHMRIHTMERPFQCSRCGKHFSRSDNLNQHYRSVHERAESADTSAGEPVAFDAEMENEEGDVPYFADLYSEVGPNDSNQYEIEFPGQVQDVHGDEEGLVVPDVPHGMTTDAASDGGLGNVYFSQPATENGSVQLGTSEMDCQWTFSDSPVMTAMSDGEPMAASLAGLPHRQEFVVDNIPLYQGVVASSEIGPHRRHRSSTPSLIRSHSTSSSGSRNYHPYSRTNSSHSSPAALPQTLDVSSYTMSSDAFNMALPRSFSAPSLSQGALDIDISDLGLDSIFSTTMAYYTEPGNFELSQQYPTSFESN